MSVQRPKGDVEGKPEGAGLRLRTSMSSQIQMQECSEMPRDSEWDWKEKSADGEQATGGRAVQQRLTEPVDIL